MNLTIDEVLKNGNSTKNQQIKGDFVGKHVYCNVNSLVEYCLAKGFEDRESPVNLDGLENFYSYPKYRGIHANFDGGTNEQRQEEIERLRELLEELGTGDNETLSENSIQQIEDEISELETLESEPQDVFEWWAVSSYLFDQLRTNGYVVIDTGSCYVWGRTTSGQAILLDHIITVICADMEILDGQSNSWARD